MHKRVDNKRPIDKTTASCLLLSCSQRKRSAEQPIGALELYDGYYYRIIAKLMRESSFPTNLDIIIVSAKYGVLRESDTILPYDQKMTAHRAAEVRDKVLGQLEFAFRNRRYQEVFVNLGRNYLEAVFGFEALLPDTVRVIYAEGGIGQRGSQMKRWILSKKDRS